jgi:pimeloyl-ACP methyl ester carboxylesterase
MSRRATFDLEAGGSVDVVVDEPKTRASRTLLILPGLGARDVTNDEDLYGSVARRAAARGLRAVRARTHGLPSALVTDVEVALAALERFGTGGIVLFGHSLGAVVAPLVAGPVCARGIITFGAPARRWADALTEGAARQLAPGLDAVDREREVESAGTLYRAVLREKRKRSALDASLLASIAAKDLTDTTLHGSPIDYLRTIDAVDPSLAWRRSSGACVALQGEHDWVVGEGDASTIAGWVAEAGRTAEAATLERIDHYGREHSSLAASWEARGRGPLSERAVDRIVEAASTI